MDGPHESSQQSRQINTRRNLQDQVCEFVTQLQPELDVEAAVYILDQIEAPREAHAQTSISSQGRAQRQFHDHEYGVYME